VFLTVAAGLVAGLLTVGFQAAMGGIFNAGIKHFSHESFTFFAVASLVVIVTTAFISGWLMNSYCPEAAGSGIPQLKVAMWKDFGYMKFRVVWVKFIAGVLQIGGGSSMGREGPSVQLAGAAGSNLVGFLGEPKQRRRLGAATGAAAGLAAAFNTPLAAVTFVLEELIGDLNSRLLGSVLLAGVLGALITHGILGAQPAFTLAPLGESDWHGYVLVPVVALLATVVGLLFQKWSIWLRPVRKQFRPGLRWMGPAVGALICWALGIIIFRETGRLGVFGLGYDDLSDALAGKLLWTTAALLLGAKLLATTACYGFGGCGGIFSPTLFFGAMAGAAVAGLAAMVIPLSSNDVVMLAIVGMSATLGAVVRAPVTSILIVFEMTHQFAIVPPLMIGALISQGLARRFATHNFYDALLEQDGHDIERLRPLDNLRAWQEQSIKALANLKPVAMASLEIPEVERVLKTSPYNRFPLVIDGVIHGIVLRDEAEEALRQKRTPKIFTADLLPPTAHLREMQSALINSETGMVLVEGEKANSLGGLFTIHDLLRAQQAAVESPE
jgi:CIC family chloride channel protein